MENLNAFVSEGDQLIGDKPPPRDCPRCHSDNTKFCYFNNYTSSQPRYFCKNCRRYWTQGGSLRNIPVGGSCRRLKRLGVDQPSASRVVSVGIQQANHRQHVQENNVFGSLPIRRLRPVHHFGLPQQDCYNLRIISNPLINKTIADSRNVVRVEEQNQWSQSLNNNNNNMSVSASTSGNRGSFPYELEKLGPY
ncbi:unnamed protein product [Cochlearia groenlandica]